MENNGSMRIGLVANSYSMFQENDAGIFIITSGIDVVIQQEVADKSPNHQQFTNRERFRGPRF